MILRVFVSALVAGLSAFSAGMLIRRGGLTRLDPVRYLPYLVFLLNIAAVPILARGSLRGSADAWVFGAAAGIWLVALLAFSLFTKT